MASRVHNLYKHAAQGARFKERGHAALDLRNRPGRLSVRILHSAISDTVTRRALIDLKAEVKRDSS